MSARMAHAGKRVHLGVNTDRAASSSLAMSKFCDPGGFEEVMRGDSEPLLRHERRQNIMRVAGFRKKRHGGFAREI